MIRTIICHLLVCCVASVLVGCNVVGAVAYKVAGEPEVPAQYELQKRSTVVIVENYEQPDLSAADADLLGRMIHGRLSGRNLAPLVEYSKVPELKGNRPKQFASMTVPQIAREVGAEQVIYVHLQAGGVSSIAGGSILQGKASVLVKVVDGATGDILWPIDSIDGRSVSFETSPLGGGDRARSQDLRAALYNGLSQQVVRLFHKWKSTDPE